MRDNIRLKRNSKGILVDVEYYLDGILSNPEKKLILTDNNKTVYYIYMKRNNRWKRIITTHDSNHVRITSVSRVLMKDYLNARDLTK